MIPYSRKRNVAVGNDVSASHSVSNFEGEKQWRRTRGRYYDYRSSFTAILDNRNFLKHYGRDQLHNFCFRMPCSKKVFSWKVDKFPTTCRARSSVSEGSALLGVDKMRTRTADRLKCRLLPVDFSRWVHFIARSQVHFTWLKSGPIIKFRKT